MSSDPCSAHLRPLAGIPLTCKGDDLAEVVLDALDRAGEKLVRHNVLLCLEIDEHLAGRTDAGGPELYAANIMIARV